MKLSKLASAVLIPALFTSLAEKSVQAKPPSVPLSAVSGSLLSFAGDMQGTPVRHQISEIIKASESPERISDPNVVAYYKLNTNVDFYIVEYKDGKYGCTYDEKDKGKLFTQTSYIHYRPVAIVDVSKAGLKGVFKIYYVSQWGNEYPGWKNGAYCIHLEDEEVTKPEVKTNRSQTSTSKPLMMPSDKHPLLYIMSNSPPDESFANDVAKAISELPDSVENDFLARGIRFVIGKEATKVSYRLYPGWKNDDDRTVIDTTKPALELFPDGSCIEHRKHKQCHAYYIDKLVVILQTYPRYPYDNISEPFRSYAYLRSTVGHEGGHALDFFNEDGYHTASSPPSDASSKKKGNGRYSADAKFLQLFEEDKKDMKPEVKNKLAYYWCNKTNGNKGEKEGTAEIVDALMGMATKDEAALILNAFPKTAEYIREKILPQFGVERSIEDIRANVYPDYLKIEVASK